jgi:pyruvate,water dikinase
MFIRLLGAGRLAILEAGASLVAEGRLDQEADVWYLELPELIHALENPAEELRPRIQERQAEMARYWKMRPPRVITSDGEIPAVHHSRNDLPAGALPGSPVSAGVVEGIAHVIIDPTKEALAKGEILVAPFTDPGWTPLFINAAGLVMEVGGLMTHGSVVAREYGIPAVVGVVDATSRLQTGQRIRVQGDKGYVELLSDA